MKKKRYEVGCQRNLHVWIFDNKKDPCGRAHGHVIRFNVLGDGHGSMNTYLQARRLAGRVCRFLNRETRCATTDQENDHDQENQPRRGQEAPCRG